MALVLGAIVANRWFHTHRGLVTGVFSAANATGQLLFLPAHRAAPRRTPGGGPPPASSPCSSLVMAVLVALLPARPAAGPRAAALRPRPRLDRGDDRPPPPSAVSPAVVAIRVLRRASRSWTFWALVLTFWVCGWSTNGIIQTHFVPAAHDHGMPATTAAGLLAVVGIFDIAGTIGSGWLTDRVDPRLLLVGLLRRPRASACSPSTPSSRRASSRRCGSSSSSTASTGWPPCRPRSRCAAPTSGSTDSGVVFGWVFASHMVGAGRRGERRRVGAHEPGRLPAGRGSSRRCCASPRSRSRCRSPGRRRPRSTPAGPAYPA